MKATISFALRGPCLVDWLQPNDRSSLTPSMTPSISASCSLHRPRRSAESEKRWPFPNRIRSPGIGALYAALREQARRAAQPGEFRHWASVETWRRPVFFLAADFGAAGNTGALPASKLMKDFAPALPDSDFGARETHVERYAGTTIGWCGALAPRRRPGSP